jgi:hypothetical protein
MDHNRFDHISKRFAQRRSTRRQAIVEGAAGLAVGALGAISVTGAAQEATPAGEDTTAPAMLFVQSFQSGSIVPKEGVEGRYTVTLDHGLGQTIYFSDRPDRIVGASPTGEFLDGLGFSATNPPNAALLVETAPGETDLAVVELFDPVYDPAGPTVTYEVEVLANWENSTDLGFSAAPADLATLAPSFGTAHLFIDDCATMDMVCFNLAGERHTIGVIPSSDYGGVCYVAGANACLPCTPSFSTYDEANTFWSEQCTIRYKDRCGTDGCGWTFLP